MRGDELNINEVALTGTVKGELTPSHTIYGETFYSGFILVGRLSAEVDCLPFTISGDLVERHGVHAGQVINVLGSLRSYNKMVEGKSKLILTVFIRDIVSEGNDYNPNIIELTGYVCKEPVFRITPSGREICDLLIAVNRPFEKSDYLPCIAWGRNARLARSLDSGAKVAINGRIQSRKYEKLVDGEMVKRTAYEISIGTLRANMP